MKTPTEDTPVSERKWTKGPWKLAAHSDSVIAGPDGKHIGAVVSQQTGWEASRGNLALIMASPDLYEALKSATAYIEALESFTGYNLEVLNWHKNGDTAPFDGFFDENRGDFDLAKARAALQRAEGEG